MPKDDDICNKSGEHCGLRSEINGLGNRVRILEDFKLGLDIFKKSHMKQEKVIENYMEIHRKDYADLNCKLSEIQSNVKVALIGQLSEAKDMICKYEEKINIKLSQNERENAKNDKENAKALTKNSVTLSIIISVIIGTVVAFFKKL